MTANQLETAAALTVTEPPAERGQTLPCPKCGEESATIDLNLSDCDTLHCQECDATFTVADVRNVIARWQPILAWMEAMPTAAD
jgi:hypothetical protein